MLTNLSYRYKMPIGIGFIILITGISVSSLFLVRSSNDSHDDLISFSKILGTTLAQTLGEMIRNDATWNAYLLIRAPHQQQLEQQIRPKEIVVLDHQSHIFSSTNPQKFPLQKNIQSLNVFFPNKGDLPIKAQTSLLIEDPKQHYLLVVLPIFVDENLVGHLALMYDTRILLPRFWVKVKDSSLATALLLLILLPFGWLVGRHIANPLIQLALCMGDLKKVPEKELKCDLNHGKDEIGQLSLRFQDMLKGLDEKRRLEKSMIKNNRLAAVGQLVAGVAHEINNPLGGMLNAIDTLQQHSKLDPLAQRTIGLLERGLNQIKNTVAALIVEARVQHHPFSQLDMEDVRTLIDTERNKRLIHLNVQSNLSASIDIPSTLLRQLLLNIVLNAIHAAPLRSQVDFSFTVKNEKLIIEIINFCEHSPSQERVDRMFEPFVSSTEQGTGLGLWISYQIVKQLEGEITASIEGSRVFINVSLPIKKNKFL